MATLSFSITEDSKMSIPDATTPTSYEFTTAENKAIGELGGQLRLVGILGMVYAIASIVSMLVAIRSTGRINIDVQPFFAFMIAFWFIKAGKSFRLVTETKGNDISHLMTALDYLRYVFGLICTLFYVVLFFVIIAMGIGLALNAKEYWISFAGHPVN